MTYEYSHYRSTAVILIRLVHLVLPNLRTIFDKSDCDATNISSVVFSTVKVTSHFHSEYFKHVFDLGRESVILGLIDTHKYLFYIAIAARPVVRKRNVVHLTLLGEEKYQPENLLKASMKACVLIS